MVDELKVGVTRSSINGALVVENEHMFAGKGSMQPNTQRLSPGSPEVAPMATGGVALPKSPGAGTESSQRDASTSKHMAPVKLDAASAARVQSRG